LLIPEGTLVVVGLASEARLLPPGARVLVSGADPARLARALEARPEGVERLLSFGLAGGLATGVARGALLAAEAVVAEGAIFLPDPAWTAEILARTGAAPAVLAGSEALLPDAAAKRALHAATRALAVDMESGVMARAAARHGLPFAVLRAVADTAEESIPRAAALTPEGRPVLPRVLLGLARRPWELPALIRLGRASAAAHAVLRQAASA
jgi:hopanoid-associated phosphorylase